MPPVTSDGRFTTRHGRFFVNNTTPQLIIPRDNRRVVLVVSLNVTVIVRTGVLSIGAPGTGIGIHFENRPTYYAPDMRFRLIEVGSILCEDVWINSAPQGISGAYIEYLNAKL